MCISPNFAIGNYTRLLGYGDNHSLTEYLRLYIALHGDHEGGNASAHTARKQRVIHLENTHPTFPKILSGPRLLILTCHTPPLCPPLLVLFTGTSLVYLYLR